MSLLDNLTRQERTVFDALRIGEAVPISEIAATVWPTHPPSDPVNNLKVHFSKMRRKLRGEFEILAIWGVGYELVRQGEEPSRSRGSYRPLFIEAAA